MGETTKVKKGKAPVKRDSEARREQNRLASRNYREKRKQKLALLNELLEPSSITSIIENGNIDNMAGPSGSTDIGAPILQDQPLPTVHPTNPLMPMNSSGFDSTGTYFLPQTWDGFTQTPILMALPNQVLPQSLPQTNKDNSLSLGTHDRLATVMPGLLQQSPQSGKLRGDYSNERHIEEVLEVFEDSPDISPNGSQETSCGEHRSLKDIIHSVDQLNTEQKRHLLRRLQQDHENSEPWPRSPQTGQQTPGQLQAIQFAKALYKTAHARPSLFPTQYTMEPGIFGAIFANCYALGMVSVDEILHDEGCSVFSVTQDEGHQPSQLHFVRSRFRDISPDLQPTENQLTFGHHPYIDVIPFKTFRENLITALNRDSNTIDEGVLCHDILSGGFTCWGAGRNSQGMGAGVPWDSRSWEPSVWFLVKYRVLAGEWDGELWKSARWWHSTRGERIQISEGTHVGDNTFTQTQRR
ncbi:hypothetical protein FBEOM_3265 [Fusarium beomiforme]|uniref:BZIP domain-containing protein n=1 Tax=Fusarium beomiforme TaxID=44412 RepID=A0A9P5APX8_9HYPO|nr:hypothetical protein FBEOM_3265 [Fusarium beomiforme]